MQNPDAVTAAAQFPIAPNETPGRSESVPNQLMVQFVPSTPVADIDAVIASIGATTLRTYRVPGLRLLVLPEAVEVEAARVELSRRPEVQVAEPNIVYHALATPNDPLFDQLWGMKNTGQFDGIVDVDIGATTAWDRRTGSRNFVIGVIDSGIDHAHEDLAANTWTNPNEIPGNLIDDDGNGWVDDIQGIDPAGDGDGIPLDVLGHGTHVAGTIAAAGNNGIGVAGVMWEASIVACQGLNAEGFGAISELIECIEYFSALDESGVEVVVTNNSWGGWGFSQLLYDAIERASLRDILFVFAAGNYGMSNDASIPVYPASFNLDNIVSVAAIGPQGSGASFSNFGDVSVDLGAPGLNVLSTLPGNQYGFASGTSMAAPHVTGVIGLAKSKLTEFTGAQLKAHVMSGARSGRFRIFTASEGWVFAELPIRDADQDGMDDDWELMSGLDPTIATDATLDPDGDGLLNLGEYLAESDIADADTDNDGLSDGAEVHAHGTNPVLADTDGDTLSDTDETGLLGTSPVLADTDDDGIRDDVEIAGGDTSPIVADTDGDGMTDGWEDRFGLDPINPADDLVDLDADGLDNGDEYAAGSDPTEVDSDRDGLGDFSEVTVYHTMPGNPDSDADSMPDGWEVGFALDPLSAADSALDPDLDSYANRSEYRTGTHPRDSGSHAVPPIWNVDNGNPLRSANVPIDSRVEDFSIRWIREEEHLPGLEQFVIDGDSIYFWSRAGGRHAIVRLDMRNGMLIWRREFPDTRSIGPPVVVNGEVFTIAESMSGGYTLHALNVADGTDRMTASIGALPWLSDWIFPQGDRLFLMGRGNDALTNILSIDPATGSVVWQTPTTLTAFEKRGLAVNDEHVADYADHVLSVLDRDTGAIVTQFSGTDCQSGREVMFDSSGDIYVLRDGCSFKFDVASRSLEWEQWRTGRVNGYSVDDDLLYVANDLDVRAVDPDTGLEVWKWWVPQPFRLLQFAESNVVSTLNHVFVGTEYTTYAFDRQSGEVVWSIPIPGALSMSPDGALTIYPGDALVIVDLVGDSDGDAAPDWWEKAFGFTYSSPADGSTDADGDGVANSAEYDARTDPRAADSDADGLGDRVELETYASDPLRTDTDYDTIADGAEALTFGSDPARTDSDGDSYADNEEVSHGTNPAATSSFPAFVGTRLESFESGFPAGWVNGASADTGWVVDPRDATHGSLALTANLGIGEDTAAVEWTGDFKAGYLSFDVRQLDPATGPRVTVFLDGLQAFQLNDSAWRSARLLLSRGRHTVRWVASTPNTGTSNLAKAWLDNVRFEEARELGTSTRHMIVAGGNLVQEVDAFGVKVGAPVSIAGNPDLTDVVMLDDRRLAILERHRLNLVDPATRHVYSIPFEAQAGDAIAAIGDEILAVNMGPTLGLLRFDRRGTFIGHALHGIEYFDITVSGDGRLYGLRRNAGVIDRIDAASFEIEQTIELAKPLGVALAVAPDGSFFVVDNDCDSCQYAITRYTAAGTLIREFERPRDLNLPGSGADDIDYLRQGRLALGRRSVGPAWVESDFTKPGLALLDSFGNTSYSVARVEVSGPDSDGDGLPDWWERANGFDPGSALDGALDPDGDGLGNFQEYSLETYFDRRDSDADGLSDAVEAASLHSDPLFSDSDEDGLDDGNEVDDYGTSPVSVDTDGDGLSDADELLVLHTNPLSVDSDADLLHDGWELANGLDPTDGSDGATDPDRDGIPSIEEHDLGTDPLNADSDYDRLSDGDELEAYSTDPLDRDSDDDRIWDDWEIAEGFNPLLDTDAVLDRDGDGFTNRLEYFAASDPDMPRSFPVIGPWATYQGDARHQGFVPMRIDPAALAALWHLDLVPQNALDLGQVVTDNGVAWVNNDVFRNYGVISALDSRTGSRLWDAHPGFATFNSGVVLAGDDVIMQTNVPGRMYAFDRNSGLQTGAGSVDSSQQLLAPTPSDGKLFAMGGLQGGVLAYDIAREAVLWQRPLGINDNWTPAVDDNLVYVYIPQSDGYEYWAALHMFYRNSGVLRRAIVDRQPQPFPTGDLADSAPVLGGRDDVIGRSGTRVARIDLRSNSVLWAHQGEFAATPSLADGVVYAQDGRSLVALAVDDGEELWRWPSPTGIDHPTLATIDHVFVSSDVATYAIRIDTGTSVWSYPEGGRLSLGNDRILYIAGIDGDLHAIRTFADQDSDGMDDSWELAKSLDRTSAADAQLDSDGDGLSNITEFRLQSEPRTLDSDADGLPDGDERLVSGTNPLSPDSDGDGLNDGTEVQINGTDPNDADTDADELGDRAEVVVHGTNPTLANSDGDAVNDRWEIELGSNPASAGSLPVPLTTVFESFESGAVPGAWLNAVNATVGWEVVTGGNHGTFRLQSEPLRNWETAAIEWTNYFASGTLSFDVRMIGSGAQYFSFTVDGVRRSFNVRSDRWTTPQIPLNAGLHTLRWDVTLATPGNADAPIVAIDSLRLITAGSDGDEDDDAMPDSWEITHGLDPASALDAAADRDGDGLSNLREYQLGTLPGNGDSDSDGMPDKWEADNSLNPLSAADAVSDPDADGASNLVEYTNGTNPRVANNPPTVPPPTSPPTSPPPSPPPAGAGGGGGGGGGGGASEPLFAVLILLAGLWQRRPRGIKHSLRADPSGRCPAI